MADMSTDTPVLGLLSVYLSMDPDFLLFVIVCSLLAVPNMHDAQRSTKSFRSRNSFGRTPSFASINMDLGCK